MSDEKLKEMYNNTLKNSVGIDKKCKFKKVLKNVKTKLTLVSLILIFLSSGLVGCNQNDYSYNNSNSNKLTTSYTTVVSNDSINNEFGEYETLKYQRIRLYELLDSYKMDDYSIVNLRRNYNYGVEDYKNIKELDESYLYMFYVDTTLDNVQTVCQALGYENLDDFMIKNEYVNKEGKPDVNVWHRKNKENINKLMKEEYGYNKGGK